MSQPVHSPRSRARASRGPAGAWNVSNGVTIGRILLVPAFVVVLFQGGGHQPGWRWAAAALFVATSVSDSLDGELARRRNEVTPFGVMADPIADKALTGAALVGLSVLGVLPWWVTVLVLAREIGVTMLRLVVIRHGVMAASRGGKLKTVLLSVAITLYLLPLAGWAATLAAWVMTAAVAVTLVTGVDYVVRAVRLRRGARAGGSRTGAAGRVR